VDGRSLSVATAAAAVAPRDQIGSDAGTDEGDGAAWWTGIYLTSLAGEACRLPFGLLGGGENTETLIITVETVGDYAGPGTYEVGPSSVVANLLQTTSDGGSGATVAATGGSVTITAATGSPALDNLAGTFALTFGSSGSFTGSFSAPVCP
jgi:hypothetical protein